MHPLCAQYQITVAKVFEHYDKQVSMVHLQTRDQGLIWQPDWTATLIKLAASLLSFFRGLSPAVPDTDLRSAILSALMDFYTRSILPIILAKFNSVPVLGQLLAQLLSSVVPSIMASIVDALLAILSQPVPTPTPAPAGGGWAPY